MNENIERNANAVQSHFYLSGQKCVKDLELFVVLTNIVGSLYSKIKYGMSWYFSPTHSAQNRPKQCSLS